MRPLLRLATFACVGAASTVAYAALAESFAYVGMRTVFASLLAYGICACWSYIGHKRFTFASDAPHHIEAPRFIAVNVAGLLVATGMPLLLARSSGASPHFAVLATCVIVPIISFVASQRFVFRSVG